MSYPTLIKIAIGIGLVLVTIIVVVRLTFFFPKSVQPADIHCSSDAANLPVNKALRVLTWNIQFGASRSNHFFYDGGESVSVSASDVAQTMQSIINTIKEADPDIILLQEVDRASRRTHFVDQHALLAEALQMPCHTSTPYFKAPYIPHPSSEHLGAMEMHLSIFSRFKITASTRHQLALLKEPAYRRLFNLKRAALVASIPTDDGREVTIINTHLSAFSHGDGTLTKQISKLLDLSSEAKPNPVILAGDFNSLPPGFDASQTADPDSYPESASPIEPLFSSLNPALDVPTLISDPSHYGTYRPFAADQTDRTIDYLFTAHGAQAQSHQVKRTPGHISDHEPLITMIDFARPASEQ